MKSLKFKMSGYSSKYVNDLFIKGLERTKNCLPVFVCLDEQTYRGTHKKCKFIDSTYGVFWCLPINIFKGVGHPSRAVEKSNKKRRDNILKKYLLKYALPEGISIDISTFTGVSKPCRFIDVVHGEWWSEARNVIKGSMVHPKNRAMKIETTMLQRYGVKSSLQHTPFFKKAMKSQCKTVELKHWKTEEIMLCTASYEVFVVNYLNEKRIDFDWQSHVFKMPDGRTYRPDAFLKNDNLFIEIKGFFWKDAREKWDWFHHNYPNSELWGEGRLRSLGYSRKRIKNG